jgi:hypothetical protein
MEKTELSFLLRDHLSETHFVPSSFDPFISQKNLKKIASLKK